MYISSLSGANQASSKKSSNIINESSDSEIKSLQEKISDVQQEIKSLTADNSITLDEKRAQQTELQMELQTLNKRLMDRRSEIQEEKQKQLEKNSEINEPKDSSVIKEDNENEPLITTGTKLSADKYVSQAETVKNVIEVMKSQTEALKDQSGTSNLNEISNDEKTLDITKVQTKISNAEQTEEEKLKELNEEEKEKLEQLKRPYNDLSGKHVDVTL